MPEAATVRDGLGVGEATAMQAIPRMRPARFERATSASAGQRSIP